MFVDIEVVLEDVVVVVVFMWFQVYWIYVFVVVEGEGKVVDGGGWVVKVVIVVKVFFVEGDG